MSKLVDHKRVERSVATMKLARLGRIAALCGSMGLAAGTIARGGGEAYFGCSGQPVTFIEEENSGTAPQEHHADSDTSTVELVRSESKTAASTIKPPAAPPLGIALGRMSLKPITIAGNRVILPAPFNGSLNVNSLAEPDAEIISLINPRNSLPSPYSLMHAGNRVARPAPLRT